MPSALGKPWKGENPTIPGLVRRREAFAKFAVQKRPSFVSASAYLIAIRHEDTFQ